MRWAFAPVLATPTRARRQLADQLCRWGIAGPESESVLLVAHELVAMPSTTLALLSSWR
jgi:hypothetical protein